MSGFIMGMDISSLPEMRDNHKNYYDFNGELRDPLALIKDYGVNYIRLRIWNEPKHVNASNGYCDLEQTAAFAKEIKSMGFQFLLDFHYSDWWADPGKQNKPKAWEKLNFTELCDALYGYTYDVCMRLKEENVFPDMIQIGNEIRSGILFPDGMVQNFENLSILLNNGIRAVRKAQSSLDTKIMLHLDQGGRYKYFEDFFDKVIKAGVVDFDVIGLSYYPFWHGKYMNLNKRWISWLNATKSL